jgi:outer membrane protein assembly factor BamE (lipoprotein component of BamABCDE complex)
MNHYFCLPTLGIAACLAACTTSGPRLVSTPVREGMTSAQLVAAFGRPLRVKRTPDGGEDWFYHFGSQQHASHPVSASTSTETERSYSVGNATSTTTTMNQAPVHLSPSGRVVGAIPSGSVVVE